MATENPLQWVNRITKDILLEDSFVLSPFYWISMENWLTAKKKWGAHSPHDQGNGGTSTLGTIPNNEGYTINFDWTFITTLKTDGLFLSTHGTPFVCTQPNSSAHIYGIYVAPPTVGGIKVIFDNNSDASGSKIFFPGVDFNQKDIFVSISFEYLTRTLGIYVYSEEGVYHDTVIINASQIANLRLLCAGIYASDITTYGRLGGYVGHTMLFNRVLTSDEIGFVIRSKIPSDELSQRGFSMNAYNWVNDGDTSGHPFDTFTYNPSSRTLSIARNGTGASGSGCTLSSYEKKFKAGSYLRIRGNITSLSNFLIRFTAEGVGNLGYTIGEMTTTGLFDFKVCLPRNQLFLAVRGFGDTTASSCVIENFTVESVGQLLNLEPDNVLPSGLWIDSSGNGNDIIPYGLTIGENSFKFFSTRDFYKRTIDAVSPDVSIPGSWNSSIPSITITSNDAILSNTRSQTNFAYPITNTFEWVMDGGQSLPNGIYEYKEPECSINGTVVHYFSNSSATQNKGSQTGKLIITYR